MSDKRAEPMQAREGETYSIKGWIGCDVGRYAREYVRYDHQPLG